VQCDTRRSKQQLQQRPPRKAAARAGHRCRNETVETENRFNLFRYSLVRGVVRLVVIITPQKMNRSSSLWASVCVWYLIQARGGNAAVLIFFESRFSVDSTKQTILSTQVVQRRTAHAFARATHWSHATSSKLGLSRACAGLNSLCLACLFSSPIASIVCGLWYLLPPIGARGLLDDTNNTAIAMFAVETAPHLPQCRSYCRPSPCCCSPAVGNKNNIAPIKSPNRAASGPSAAASPCPKPSIPMCTTA